MMKRYLFPRQRKKRPQSDARIFFAAFAVASSLLLLAVVLQQTATSGRSIAPKLPPPAFSTFLPDGAQTTGATLELADLPQPSYVVAYERDGYAGLTLIAWNQEIQRYVRASDLPLADGPAHLARATELSLETMGVGAQPVILARGPVGGTVDGTFVLKRDPDGLRLAKTLDEYKKTGPAFFPAGQDEQGQEHLAFTDMDADGRKEAIAAQRVPGTRGGSQKTPARAYRWSSGTLVYDKDLSWALAVDRDLFPEPKDAAADSPAKK